MTPMGKRFSNHVWAEICRRYVDDREPAKRLAQEFGVSTSAIYKRASRSNWPAAISGASSVDEVLVRVESLIERFEAALRRSHGHIE